MKNEEQRIWNKSELEAHPDWRVGRVAYLGTWINDKSEYCITADMVGQTVQWCEEQGFSVTPEMIATEQPKTAIAANGTELVVGGRYRLEFWNKDDFFQILFIGEKAIFVKPETGFECSYLINNNWLPYTEPKEEPKPLEGYQKWYCLNLVADTINVEWFKEQPQNNNYWNYYTEQEAIDLGLVI